MKIPSLILKQLYTFGSLENSPEGVRFTLKNRLSGASLVGVTALRVDGAQVPLERVRLELGDGDSVAATDVSAGRPLPFPLRRQVHMLWQGATLEDGSHELDWVSSHEKYGRNR